MGVGIVNFRILLLPEQLCLLLSNFQFRSFSFGAFRISNVSGFDTL